MGLHRGFVERYPDLQIVGVDVKPQPHYPFTFVQGDALNPPLDLRDFDFIWASPPCQAYTGLRKITLSRFGHVKTVHPDLINATRLLLRESGAVWAIENVVNSPLKTQIILCGVSLGLPRLARHRHFELSTLIFAPPCSHRQVDHTVGVYGKKPDGRRVSYRHHRLGRVARGLKEGQEVMGIDWMDWDELKEAVPPAYSGYIARQIQL